MINSRNFSSKEYKDSRLLYKVVNVSVTTTYTVDDSTILPYSIRVGFASFRGKRQLCIYIILSE